MARGITISVLILLILLLGSTFVTIYIRFVLSKTKDTPKELFDNIIKIFGPGNDRRLIDLGAGNFEFIFAAERSGFKVDGVEISPFLVVIGKFKKLIKRSKANIKQKNMYKTYLKDLDLIYINQQENQLNTLKNKISAECRDECEIYLFNGSFSGISPEKSYKLGDGSILNKYRGDQFK